jgi:hypothetical protein
MILNVREISLLFFFIKLFSFLFFEGLRLVFVLLDHTGDISSLTQSLESFIIKQGLDNMLKNKDTIRQVYLIEL